MDTKPLAPGTVLKGRYRVVRLVAGGGMAWVYEVEEPRLDGSSQRWALKELRADSGASTDLREARQLFEQEANILVRLDHPNLPQVVAFFELDGRSYLVMEFVHGESLAKRLDRANAPLLEVEVLDLAIQVCDVLDYLHSRPTPVIFRDLKPSNIMVTPDGSVKLIDFGIARTYKAGQRRDTVTMGSENYAAPEQWGEAQTDARSDIYGLGATMYHLLTNTAPLPAFVPSRRVPLRELNPAVSEETAAVVARATSHDREARFQTAAEMREALAECLPRRERRRIEQRLARRHQRARTEAEPAPQPSAAPAPARPTPVVPDLAAASPERAPARAPERAPAPVAARYCPACGAENRADARFCRRCGQSMTAEPATLRLAEPRTDGWRFALRRRVTLVGRRGGELPVDLDLTPFDPQGYVSRNHARFTSFRGRHHIIDLDSANGTYVNGRRLTPRVPHPLRPGDRIRMGKIELLFAAA